MPTPLPAGTRLLHISPHKTGTTGLLRPVPDTANRSLALAETEMLRNLNQEFRTNELPAELYSQFVRNGAVMHMKNTCTPGPGDVKIGTPHWAVEAAAAPVRLR